MFERILPTNEHPIERVIRIAFGVAVLALAFVGPRTAWAYLGAVPLVTGLVGSCPVYTLFGIDTCPYTPSRKTTLCSFAAQLWEIVRHSTIS
jgi:hypothetical protein